MNGKNDAVPGFQIASELKGIMKASLVGMAVFDHDTRVLYANPLAERLFEKRITESVGVKCGDFIGCARRQTDPQGCGHTGHCPACPLSRAIRAACSGEPGTAVQEGEALLERETGLSSIWVKFKVSGLVVKGRKVAIMAVDDITRQRKDEEKLRHALAELSVIHEHAPVAMMLVDRDRRVRKVNGFAAKFADRPSNEMIGLRGGEALRCLHHLDDPQGCGFGPACARCRVRQAVLDTFETRLSQTGIEAWLPFPRGESSEERCLLISTAYLKIDSTERVLVCSQDITALKQTKKDLAHSHDLMRYIIEHAS
ncbi:MAG: PAS domain-containing protein, partial [Deltaproteobacteria bacterium]|nr:PAS domain-containing protein [Deltaproteobacteria bacterium]